MEVTTEEWTLITSALLNRTAQMFKPKEVRAITDFIQTAKEDVPEVVRLLNAKANDPDA